MLEGLLDHIWGEGLIGDICTWLVKNSVYEKEKGDLTKHLLCKASACRMKIMVGAIFQKCCSLSLYR